MKLIDVAVSHFNSKEVRQLEVPQWETTIYAKNLSLSDKSKWMKRADGDNWNYLVYAVIFGATDEKGDPLFDIGDKPLWLTVLILTLLQRLPVSY